MKDLDQKRDRLQTLVAIAVAIGCSSATLSATLAAMALNAPAATVRASARTV